MAEKDPDTGPTLELPSLFGRRRRRGDQADAPSADATTTIPTVDQNPQAHAPAAVPTPVPPPGHHSATTEPTPRTTEPTPRSTTQPAGSTGATAASPAVSSPPPAVSSAPPAASPTAAPAGGRRRAGTGGPSLPEVGLSTAALGVGAAIGLMGCVLTWLGLRGCEVVTGTSSCGGPGLLVLVVILAVMVLAGTVVLRALRVPDPGSVSFLGVGIMTVIALLFLIDYLYDPWMFLVVPLVTALSFAVARWVTTLYADDLDNDDGGMPHHDIR